jgi:oxygen-independent coproporphyrinogen-3 oxidase
MAGVYIHIPFCKQKCHYCNFFSLATQRYRKEFFEALLNEIVARRDYLEGETLGTVYFGGGTPSLLSGSEINRIIELLQKTFPVSKDAEITLEANPDDVSWEWLSSLRSTSVNRLSLGIQSFFDEDLHYLNRVHQSDQAMKAIKMVRDAGYENITIDLIYGIPGLSMEKWQKNLETFFSLSIPHLSAYALTVEKRTALHHLISKGKLPAPDESDSIGHFRLLQKLTLEMGYIHYEISNFSLPGHYSRHNSIYWLGGNYLGLGPSAHSYNGKSRQWNVSNLGQYIRGMANPEKIIETEQLSVSQRFNEYVMTSLRTVWGCDSEHIRNVFGEKRKDLFIDSTGKFIKRGLLRCEGSIYYLTEEGKLFADGIASELFADEAD